MTESESKSAGKYSLLYLSQNVTGSETKSAGKYMLLPPKIILGSAGLRPAENNKIRHN